jgi:hypothetical protein
MVTFHAFPCLPAELRILVWQYAVQKRVLRVKKHGSMNKGFWSPNSVPAITRVCRESRKHCSYQKAFIINCFPRYIWTNFESDIVQTRSALVAQISVAERDAIEHLRIEMIDDWGFNEGDSYFYYTRGEIRYFAKLK